MLEAYYFADARAVKQVLVGIELDDYEGDVETIPHPKNKLKNLYRGFDEIEHGGRIVDALRVCHVLSRRDECSTLRTMFAWLCKAIGESEGDACRLVDGRYSEVTKDQICALAACEREP